MPRKPARRQGSPAPEIRSRKARDGPWEEAIVLKELRKVVIGKARRLKVRLQLWWTFVKPDPGPCEDFARLARQLKAELQLWWTFVKLDPDPGRGAKGLIEFVSCVTRRCAPELKELAEKMLFLLAGHPEPAPSWWAIGAAYLGLNCYNMVLRCARV